MRALADLLYPHACVGCRRLARGGFCSGCIAALARLGPSVCATCGSPGGRSPCADCRGRGFAFTLARQSVPFTWPVREAIHRFKYRSERALADGLAQLVCEVARGSVFDAVTWVPPSHARARERGFDHAQLLARAVAAQSGVPAVALLERTRTAPPQVSLEADARRRNLDHAMRARLPAPARIAVIDDVFTTGATASESARALVESGAEVVYAFAVARTVR